MGNLHTFKKKWFFLKFYFKYGANIESTDNQGRNALSYAREAKSQECIQLLIHNGSSENNQQINVNQPNTLSKKTGSNSYIGFLNNALSNCNNNNNNNNQAGHYDKIPYNVV